MALHGDNRLGSLWARVPWRVLDVSVIILSLFLSFVILSPLVISDSGEPRRMHCLANLKSIGTGCFLYMEDNQGVPPPSLDYLVEESLVPSRALSCPARRGADGADGYPYIYVRPLTSKDDPQKILAYEPRSCDWKFNIVGCGGQAQRIKAADFHQQLRQLHEWQAHKRQEQQ